MLQGFLSPSTTVTTLKFSPGGPGGCASAAPHTATITAQNASETGQRRLVEGSVETAVIWCPRKIEVVLEYIEGLVTCTAGRA